MHAGGAGADVQLGADLGVGPPGGQQPQHRQLTVGQPVTGQHLGRRRSAGLAGRRGLQRDPGPFGQRADLGQQRGVPVGGGRGRPQRGGRRRGRLPGVQLRLGLPPPGVPGPVRAAQVLPGFRCAVPGIGIAGPGHPGPLGVPGGALSRDGGHDRVVGERRAAHLLDPGGQAVGRVRGVGSGLLVAARPGLLGQVSTRPHARRQQPPGINGQVRALEHGQRPPDLLNSIAGASRPQRGLRCPRRELVGEADF